MAATVIVQAPQIGDTPRLGNLVAATALTLLFIGLCIEVALRLSLGRDVVTWTLAQTALTTCGFCLSGRILVRPAAARPVGKILILSGCAGAWSCFFSALGNIALIQNPGLAVPLHLIAQMSWPLYVIPVLTLLPLIFPTGALRNRRWHVMIWTSVMSMAVLMTAEATSEKIITNEPGGPVLSNPISLEDWFPVLIVTGSVLASGSVLAGLVALVLRWVQGTRLVRQQISMLAVSLLIFLLFQAGYPVLDFDVFEFGMTITPLLVITAIAVAVLRYELYDMHLVLKRVAIYACLTVLLTALFLAVYLGVLVFAARLSINSSPWLAVVIGGVVVVLCAEPGRRRLQALLEQRVFGDRGRPLVAMARLRESALETDDRAVLTAITTTIAGAVKSPGAALELHENGCLHRVATTGQLTNDPLTLALLYRQEKLGQLLISRRTPTEGYGARDRELLEQLGDQASAIVYGLRRDTELVRARQEAVASAAEVRAQLGRDLHDGFAPLLAGAGLAAEALRRGFEPGSSDEAGAARLAERLRTAAGEARRFAHDLQPAALTDTSLVTAVRDWIDSLRCAGTPAIELDADDRDLPQAIEQAAYFFVLEAVTNVIRHAHASKVTVTIRHAPGSLLLTVQDNGTGLIVPYVSGVGLTSMRQRIQALDGTFDIRTSPSGGTTVTADIPVPA